MEKSTQATLEQSATQKVKVTLLLRGGGQYYVYMQSDEPLLRNLMTVLVARSQKPDQDLGGLFQIPIEQGQACLCFASHDLVGLITEPGIFIQPIDDPNTQTEPNIQTTHQPTTDPPLLVYPEPQIKPASETIIKSDYVQLDNFLTPEEKNRLLTYVLLQETAFVPTTTSTGEANYRESMVLYSFPDFFKLMVDRVKGTLPTIFKKLGMQPFAIADIEAQITSHNDGHFYKVHNDNGSQAVANREFTYVYYFHREPKSFSGGELWIYDSKIENSLYVKADTHHTVEPRNNSIVFFPSRYHHEVLPIKCPSRAFVDSRFTVNGWVRRQS
jgi:Rps23 Pro-64 3,4-dihydroxylase Tpa1-like proline 4-hydroxylase